MGLTNDERSSLVELRLEKAKRFIAEAEQMLSMGLWDLAANRFYYSCFHAAQALLIHYGLSAHTHAGTLGVFGMNFVKTGKIDKELGAFFSRMEQLRMKADYNCEYDPAPYCRHIVVALFYGQTVRHFTLSLKDFFNPSTIFIRKINLFLRKAKRNPPKTCRREKYFIYLQPDKKEKRWQRKI